MCRRPFIMSESIAPDFNAVEILLRNLADEVRALKGSGDARDSKLHELDKELIAIKSRLDTFVTAENVHRMLAPQQEEIRAVREELARRGAQLDEIRTDVRTLVEATTQSQELTRDLAKNLESFQGQAMGEIERLRRDREESDLKKQLQELATKNQDLETKLSGLTVKGILKSLGGHSTQIGAIGAALALLGAAVSGGLEWIVKVMGLQWPF